MEVFDFVNAILTNGKDLWQEAQAEKTYVPYLVNKALSYYPDTILLAEDMNLCPNLDKDMQFYYLLNTVKKQKRRFQKWSKTQKDADVEMLQEHYGYSRKNAITALNLLTDEQLNEIKNNIKTGGVVK